MPTNRYDQGSRHLARRGGARLWFWLLVTLGLIRLTQRPSAEAGDRYWVGAVVINLTGQGQAQRDLEWRGAGLRLLVQPREWNFGELGAARVMDEVERGTVPVEALGWAPVMKRGGDPVMIQRWLGLARRETDRQRRADLGLARVFAELVGRQAVWHKALEGWNVLGSPFMKEWEDKARSAARAESLIQVLEKRFKTVPDDLRQAILAECNAQRLTDLVDVAFATRSLPGFRRKAGL